MSCSTSFRLAGLSSTYSSGAQRRAVAHVRGRARTRLVAASGELRRRRRRSARTRTRFPPRRRSPRRSRRPSAPPAAWSPPGRCRCPPRRAGLLPEPVERLEQLRQLVRRQPGAGVPDADANAPGRDRACSRPRPCPAARLYLMALESRLISTCFNAGAVGVDEARACRSAGRSCAMPRFCACGSIIAWHSSMTSASDTGSERQRQLSRLDHAPDRGSR